MELNHNNLWRLLFAEVAEESSALLFTAAYTWRRQVCAVFSIITVFREALLVTASTVTEVISEYLPSARAEPSMSSRFNSRAMPTCRQLMPRHQKEASEPAKVPEKFPYMRLYISPYNRSAHGYVTVHVKIKRKSAKILAMDYENTMPDEPS